MTDCQFECYRCERKRYGHDFWPFKRSTYHLCKGKGHCVGSVMCPGKKEPSGKKAYIPSKNTSSRGRLVYK